MATNVEKMTITVPEGWTNGTVMNIKTPSGKPVLFQFPEGSTYKPGQKVDVNIPVKEDTAMDAKPKHPGHLNSTDDPEAPKTSALELYNKADYPNGDADVMEASLNSGLTFHELTLVIWRKKDTVFAADMATVGPAIFDFVDKDGSGTMTIDEFVAALVDETLMTFVKGIKCPVLRRLFSEKEEYMRQGFKKIDDDGSGQIDKVEWMKFLSNVQKERLTYYKQRFLLQGKTYAGLGMEPGEPVETFAFESCGVRE